ncbi:HAD-IIIA family hydrolase [Candidatus Giovannonibacteria bacterium]|nr:HAD-IIIA family hydrolase [Candidatus Giovannonibacteria bacterium]
MLPLKKRAVFLDRDGVINEVVDRGENCEVLGKKVRWTAPWSYQEFRIKSGVNDELSKLGGLGFLKILVTNQPDLTYGLLSQEDHNLIMKDIGKLPFDDVYVCIHGRNDGCDCKKPKPGMLLSAANKWGIDLKGSFIVGDSGSDIEAGKSAGVSTILINGEQNLGVEADYHVSDLPEATGKLS